MISQELKRAVCFPLPILRGQNRGMLWTAGTLKYFTGRFEPTKAKALMAAVRKEDVVWDIGAHRGYFTLMFAKQTAGAGTVYAFEPYRENFLALARHVRWNRLQNVKAFDIALSDFSGPSGFRKGRSSLGGQLANDGVIDVHVANPADLIASGQVQAPSFLKLDAEHSEARILRAFGSYLASPNICVALSVHSHQLVEECTEILMSHGCAMVRSRKLASFAPGERFGGDAEIFAFGRDRAPSESLTNLIETIG